MINRLLAALLCAAFLISFSPVAYAAEGNMDGDGGDMGSGTGESYWNPGNDGVRITVINKNTKTAVGNSFDVNYPQDVNFSTAQNSDFRFNISHFSIAL